MTSAPVVVLDSASLYFRSFFALPESMTAPDGRPHNAIRGFLATVTRLIERHRPRAVVAAWDEDWRPAWRVALLPSYKTHRVAEPVGGGSSPATTQAPPAETEPESLGPQARAIHDLLTALGIGVWGVRGYEADDVVASVAAQTPTAVVAVSGDRDLVQVVSATTRLHLAVNGGMDKWPLLDPRGVEDRFDVPPNRYVDFAVLRGDPSDGIPGAPGIGPKTAAALVRAFGGIDEILAAAHDEPGRPPLTARIAAVLGAHRDALVRARTVATAVDDLVLPDPAPLLTDQPADPSALVALSAGWGVERQVADLQRAIAVGRD